MNSLSLFQKTILVVDDEPSILEILALYFEMLGATVLCAKNGNEALHISRKTPLDLILSDIKMPECNGIMLLNEIRKTHPKYPIIFLMTGFSEDIPELLRGQGADDFISKPFKIRELEEKMEEAFQRVFSVRADAGSLEQSIDSDLN